TNEPYSFILNDVGTSSDVYKPAKPVLTYPAMSRGSRVSIAHNSTTGQRPWFLWSDAGGPNKKTLSYKLTLSGSQDMTNVVYEKAALAGLGHQVETDFYTDGAVYYVQITATDSNGNSTSSDVYDWKYVAPETSYSVRVLDAANGSVAYAADPAVQNVETCAAGQGCHEMELHDGLTQGTYQWTVTAKDPAGNATTSAPFTIDVTRYDPAIITKMVFPGVAIANAAPTLIWQSSSDALLFDVQVSSDANFGNVVWESLDIPAAQAVGENHYVSIPPSTLSPGNVYFWRVSAQNDLASCRGASPCVSEWSSKRVQVIDTSPSYELQLMADGDMVTSVPGIRKLAAAQDPSHTLEDRHALVEGRSYTWKIVATDMAGNSADSSQTWNLTAHDLYAPPVPQLTYPLLVTANQQPTFIWSLVSDPSGVEYKMELSNEANMANIVADSGWTPHTNFATPQNVSFAKGSTIYTRLSVRDLNDGTTGTANNEALGPIKTVQVKNTNISYAWSLYKGGVGTDNGNGDFWSQKTLVGNTMHSLGNVEALDENAAYYWTVTATDFAGNATEATGAFDNSGNACSSGAGCRWLKTDLQDNFGPIMGNLAYPPNHETILSTSPTLVWTRATDSTGISGYYVQVSRQSNFSNPIVDVGPIPPTVYERMGYDFGAANITLDPGETYYWRVWAQDPSGNISQKPYSIFHTQNNRPSYALVLYEGNDTTSAAGTLPIVSNFQGQLIVGSSPSARSYRLPSAFALDSGPSGKEYVWTMKATDRAGNETFANSPFIMALEDTYAPEATAALFPRHNETIVNREPCFAWEQATDHNGVSYTFELQKRTKVNPLQYGTVLSKSGLAENNPMVCLSDESMTLGLGAHYRWRIRYSDNNTPSPNHAWGTYSKFVVSDATLEYSFYLSDETTFADPMIASEGIRVGENKTEVSRTFSSAVLEDGGKTYHWRVKVTDPAGNETWNNPTPAPATDYFTLALSDTFPPVVSTITYPYNNARLINQATPFTWTQTSDTNGPVEYALQISENEYFNTLVRFNGETDLVTTNNGQDAFYTFNPTVAALTKNKWYYARVKATDQPVVDGNGDVTKPAYSSYGPAIRFRIDGRIEYKLAIRGAGGPIMSIDKITSTTRTLTEQEGSVLVADNRDYFWKVTAKDPAGNERVSAEYSFHLEDVYPPVVPEQVYPAHNASVADVTPTLLFTKTYDLSASTDQAGDVLYQVVVEGNCNAIAEHCVEQSSTWKTVNDFSKSDAFNEGTVLGFDVRSLYVGPLHTNLQYLWKVNVKDQNGFIATTPQRAFRIKRKSVNYKVRLVDTAGSAFHETSVGTTRYQLTDNDLLQDSQTFRWYVDAYDVAGNTTTVGPWWVTMADNYGPIASVEGKPLTLIYPRHGQSYLQPPAGFLWTTVYDPGGVEYSYEIATNEAMTNTVYTSSWEALTPEFGEETVGQALGTGLNFTANTNYYWRVGARDSSGNVTYKGPHRFKVRVASANRYTVTVRLIDDNGVVASGNPWYERSGYFNPVDGQISHVTDSSRPLPGPGDYQWCVTVKDIAGNETQGSAIADGPPGCRVFSLTDEFGPTPSVAVYPRVGEDLIKRRVGFVWTPGADHSLPISYQLQVSTTQDFSSGTTTLATGLANPGYQTGSGDILFNPGTLYYWRVISADNFGNATTSETYTFRVRSKTIRYDFAIGSAHSTSTPSFAGSDAVYHRDNINVTTHTIPDSMPLDEINIYNPDERYYWMVTAKDEAGNSQTSTGADNMCQDNTCLAFKLDDDFAPSIPVQIYPKPGDVMLNPRPSFSWTPSFDSSGIKAYVFELAEDPDFNVKVFDPVEITVTDAAVDAKYELSDDLQRGKNYFWRVRARDNYKYSEGLYHESIGPTEAFGIKALDVSYNLQMAHSKVSDGNGGETLGTLVLDIQGLTDPSYELTVQEALVKNQDYYWTVVRTDASGNQQPANDIYKVRVDNYNNLTPGGLAGTYYSDIVYPETTGDQILYWPLNGNFDDFSNTANTATSYGNVTADAGRYMGGYALQGGGSRLEHDYVDFDVNKISIEFWVKPEAVNLSEAGCNDGDECADIYTDLAGLHTENGWGSLVALDHKGRLVWKQPMRNTPTPNVCSNDLGQTCTTDEACEGDGVCQATTMPNVGTWTPTHCTEVTTTYTPVLDQWTHIVATYDGTSARLYANGVQQGAEACAISDATSAKFFVGSVNLENGFTGVVDEVRLYRRALLAPEVQNHSNNLFFSSQTPALSRQDAQIDFPLMADGNQLGDFATGVGNDSFTGRWEGYILLDYNEVYTFYGSANDGQRLWINGELVIDDWVTNGMTADPNCSGDEACATFDVTALATGADWYPFVYEFYDNLDEAFARLSFSSASETKKVVPAEHFATMPDGSDSTPPVVDNFFVSDLAPGFATVQVTTNEKTTAKVYYGSTVPSSGGPGAFASNVTSLTPDGTNELSEYSHSILLTGVPSGTFYYQIVVSDSAGNSTIQDAQMACAPSSDDLTTGKLRAKFYSGTNFETKRLTTHTTFVDFTEGSLPADVMTALGQSTTNFSVKWSGLYQAQAGDTNFKVTSNDGQRFYLDGKRLVNDWTERANGVAGSVVKTVDLGTGGWRAIRYEMFQKISDMVAQVQHQTGNSVYGTISGANYGYLSHDFIGPRYSDVTLPEIVSQANGSSLTPVTLTEPGIFDCRDPNPTVSHNAPAGGFALGTHQVTWTAVNRFGEQTTKIQVVRITDTTPPTIAGTPDLQLSCDSPKLDGMTPKDRLALNEPTITDDADPSPTWTDNAPAEFELSKTCGGFSGACPSGMLCESDWKTCSNSGAVCATDTDCAGGTCDSSSVCVTPVTVTAQDLGGLTSSTTYKVAVVDNANITLDLGPNNIEVLNATPAPANGTDYDLGRRCSVPQDVLDNPQDYVKDYDANTMTLGSQGTWVRIRQPEIRGLCEAGDSSITMDHDYPKTKVSGFLSSATEEAEKRLTLCLPHNTNGAGPVALTSQITWQVYDGATPKGEDCTNLNPGEDCPRTLNVAVHNSGYLILLTDYTGKRPEDAVFMQGNSDATRPFVKSHVCQQLGESPCGASLVTANNWNNDANYSTNGIQWKVADGDASMAPFWSEKDDATASFHATFNKENIYCPLSLTADIDTTAGTLKAFGRMSSFSANGMVTNGDYACFGIDNTAPAHNFELTQRWYPADNAKSSAKLDTNPMDKTTYPHFYIGKPLPIDIAATDQGAVHNAGINNIQLVWTNVDTDTTTTLLDGQCDTDPFYLTGPMGANPLNGDCVGEVVCPNKAEACIQDPFNGKLSLDLETLGRGHHKLQVRVLDMAGNVAENDFYIEVVDLPEQINAWMGWLQGYQNRGEGSSGALAAVDNALDNVSRASSLYVDAPDEGMRLMRAAWDQIEVADEQNLDVWKLTTDIPQAIMYETRRIADAYYKAAPATWSMLDNGAFKLPCNNDATCFASGESTLAGACVKPHPDASSGFCQIGTCSTDADCTWQHGDYCVTPPGATNGYCAVAYAITESPYFDVDRDKVNPARFLAAAFEKYSEAETELSSGSNTALTDSMDKSLESLEQLAPLYSNRIYADLYDQAVATVTNYNGDEVSYGLTCTSHGDCAGLLGGYCYIEGTNESGVCKREEAYFGNAQRGGLIYGGDMGASIASSIVAQVERVIASGAFPALTVQLNEVLAYLRDFAFGVHKNGCVAGATVANCSNLTLYGNLEAVIRIYMNGITALEKLKLLNPQQFETRRWRLGVMNTMIVVMNYSFYEGQVGTYYKQRDGIPLEFENAIVGGPYGERVPGDPKTYVDESGNTQNIPARHLVVECLLHRIAHHLGRGELDEAEDLFQNAKCLYVDFYNEMLGAVNPTDRLYNSYDLCLEYASEYQGNTSYNWTSIFSEASTFWGCPVQGVHPSGCQKVDISAITTSTFDPTDEPSICGSSNFQAWTGCDEMSCVFSGGTGQ
ncbi:MAG: hypothetical protein CMH56_13125, partial [Myxococcales bacterium]|nr:hypothetical protein [Myxococcales bacterium]